MPVAGRTATKTQASSALEMVSGLVQQGTESFFATQRILLDLVMRQNSLTINAVRDVLSWKVPESEFSLTELAGEATSNFIEAQRIVLNLAQSQTELLVGGVKDRVGFSKTATAIADVFGKSVDTLIEMQQHFLATASRQAKAVVEAAKSGEEFAGKSGGEVAREAIDTFVRAQKKFLDMVANEVTRVAEGEEGEPRDATALTEIARQASDAFIEAQKKLLDVAGSQSEINIKAARRAVEVLTPTPKFNAAGFTRDTVDSFVTAQKALLDVVMRPRRAQAREAAEEEAPRAKRPVRPRLTKQVQPA
ncbi:MAG: hypothetical protein JSU00_19950 [Acidobacteria bacterium]|nr:hypothetical protein [Acidobacteriota bacterium]